MMSACGWPEPSTGIRLPRGQCGQACNSRVSVFSSRIARSRYFSRISSSVTGIAPWDLTTRCLVLGGASTVAPCLMASTLPGSPLDPLDPPCPARLTRRRRGGPGLQELERLHVQQRGGPGEDVGVAKRLQALLRPVEVAHA